MTLGLGGFLADTEGADKSNTFPRDYVPSRVQTSVRQRVRSAVDRQPEAWETLLTNRLFDTA